MRRTKVYEVTRKKPTFTWHKLTIKHAVYAALKELKRADVPKIVGTVLAKDGYHTKQKDTDQQIRYYLWKFVQEGLLKERPDRRYAPRPEVLKAMAPPKKRKKVA